MFYSKSTGGFYSREMHGDNMPPDVVEITPGQHAALLRGEAMGLLIVADANGAPELADPPAPTLAQVQAQLSAAVQQHLDEVAQRRGYDHINSAVSYADEPEVLKYQTEGRAFRKWRSQVWRRCGEVLNQVQVGERAVPTEQELIGLLPEVVL